MTTLPPCKKSTSLECESRRMMLMMIARTDNSRSMKVQKMSPICFRTLIAHFNPSECNEHLIYRLILKIPPRCDTDDVSPRT